MEGLIFLMLFVIVGTGMVNVIKTSKENEKLEVLKEKAYVKRKIDSVYLDGNGILNKTFLIVFKVGNEEIKCVMKEKTYNSIPESTHGVLTHKGTSFINFEYDN